MGKSCVHEACEWKIMSCSRGSSGQECIHIFFHETFWFMGMELSIRMCLHLKGFCNSHFPTGRRCTCASNKEFERSSDSDVLWLISRKRLYSRDGKLHVGCKWHVRWNPVQKDKRQCVQHSSPSLAVFSLHMKTWQAAGLEMRCRFVAACVTQELLVRWCWTVIEVSGSCSLVSHTSKSTSCCCFSSGSLTGQHYSFLGEKEKGSLCDKRVKGPLVSAWLHQKDCVLRQAERGIQKLIIWGHALLDRQAEQRNKSFVLISFSSLLLTPGHEE